MTGVILKCKTSSWSNCTAKPVWMDIVFWNIHAALFIAFRAIEARTLSVAKGGPNSVIRIISKGSMPAVSHSKSILCLLNAPTWIRFRMCATCRGSSVFSGSLKSTTSTATNFFSPLSWRTCIDASVKVKRWVTTTIHPGFRSETGPGGRCSIRADTVRPTRWAAAKVTGSKSPAFLRSSSSWFMNAWNACVSSGCKSGRRKCDSSPSGHIHAPIAHTAPLACRICPVPSCSATSPSEDGPWNAFRASFISPLALSSAASRFRLTIKNVAVSSSDLVRPDRSALDRRPVPTTPLPDTTRSSSAQRSGMRLRLEPCCGGAVGVLSLSGESYFSLV
mmetsp:Transcript_44133/g.105103  ORF Transcript_44133/g.105103 Transcript_44133/m.105103 type:complete len:334 (+) Transcript_44133:457-1458(+)